MDNSQNKKRIFSGVQPSGNLHIGNYIGAIKRWVALQEDFETFFCVVDLHAITVAQDPKVLREKIREIAAWYIAAGIDLEKSSIFIQSHVPAHCELAWILNCFAPMGWLERMTQFKDKSKKENQERISVGLFDYPVLMAADILLYDTDIVPVGDDQKQHVELARDLAIRFNNMFGDIFTVPEPQIAQTGARIMGLDDANIKMSKSNKGKWHAINLIDEPDVIVDKIKRAATDSHREIVFDKSRTEIYNLLSIYKIFSNQSNEEIENHFAGKGYADFKKDLANAIIDGLKPVQTKFKELMTNQDYLDKILLSGKEKVQTIATKKIAEVKKVVGLG